MKLNNKNVSLSFINSKKYPSNVPFSPKERYPEYKGESLDPTNEVYSGVRNALYYLGLDRENFGTPAWSPLKELIKPGMSVFIKPNTVTHVHEERKDILSVIVHASVLRPILDYVIIALENRGRITIGDSQLYMSDFDKAMIASQIRDLLNWYRNQTSIPIDCIDLRKEKGVRTWLYGRWARKQVQQDSLGYNFVDLGNMSCFEGIDPKRLRIAIASHKNMVKYHSQGKHQYLFPNSFLQSDVVISIPKLKTHRRTGVTIALKNFMGIPSLKDSLPHFITGSPDEGGDQYIHSSRRKNIVTKLHDQIQSNPYIPIKFICAIAKKAIWNSHKIYQFKDDIYEAMWYGNDTLWRTLLDLNRAVFYADKNGLIRNSQQRGFLCIVDGVIGGEKDGPLAPEPVPSGVLLAGFNPVAVDSASATLMGFDINKIPLIKKCLGDVDVECPIYPRSHQEVLVSDGENMFNLHELFLRYNLKFEPHPGWKGHIELEG